MVTLRLLHLRTFRCSGLAQPMPIPADWGRKPIPPAYFDAVHASREAYQEGLEDREAKLRCTHADHTKLGTPTWMEEQGEEVSMRQNEYFSALDCLLDDIETRVRSHRCSS